MIIKKITIKNFRSYYGAISFDISERLTLIVGSNGDGKSTFFDALAWVFDTSGTKIEDIKHISKKRISELLPNESDEVRVSLEYEHSGKKRLIEKSFRFTKTLDNSISLSNPLFVLYKSTNSGKDYVSGNAFNVDFPIQFRQYSMFKGEDRLDVFKSSDSLKVLLDLFSDVKGFDPYIKFMSDSVVSANSAADTARSKDRSNARKASELRNAISISSKALENMEDELKKKEKTVTDLSLALEDIEGNQEKTELLISTNRRLDSLHSRKADYYSKIKENYTTRLLDEMWVLMGFEQIAKEYTSKVRLLSKEKRKQEKEYNQQLGAKKLATQIELGFVPLAVNVPDKKTMEELLEDEVCKVCGRPAPKGSDPWNFMKHKLEDYLKSLTVDTDEDDSKYVSQYVEELANLDTMLNNNLKKQVTGVPQSIQNAISLNEDYHEKIERVEESIAEAQDQKIRLLAGSEGLSEDDLTSIYHKIANYTEQKSRAERRVAELKNRIPEQRQLLAEQTEKLRSLSKDSVAAAYDNTCDILSLIKTAFEESKALNKKNLLTQIEDLANEYLKILNVDDFKAKIRISEPTTDTAVARLVDIDNMEISTPNTAHKTTQYMAILFAISKLAELKNESEFPLLFDAPTSSFTEAKESEFFNVFSGLNKQVIIVTKSFLRDASNGASVLDLNRISNIDGRVYRIEKKRPFNDEDLSTIQTINSKIK